jgi:methyl-accepting chemotaxis protein
LKKIYETYPKTKEEESMWNKFNELLITWKAEHDKLISISKEYLKAQSENSKNTNQIYENLYDQTWTTVHEPFFAVENQLDSIVYIQLTAAKSDMTESHDLLKSTNLEIIIATLVAILLAILIGIFLSIKVLKRPVNQLVIAANKISSGDTNVDITINTKDELGMLSNSFKSIVDNIKNYANAADFVAKGDLEVNVNIKSDKDILGKSLSNIVIILKSLVEESKSLTDAAISGKLEARGNADKFEGGFKKLIEGFNNTIDAIVEPLNVAAEYVDRISKGDIPKKITDSYNGDFNEIKNNLNNCIDNLNGLVNEATILEEAAIEGRLRTRASIDNVLGDYRKLLEGINRTLDSVINHIDEIPSPVMIIDNDFNVRYINKIGAQVGGKNPQELLGTKCYNHFKTDDCPSGDCAMARAMKRGDKFSAETIAHPGNLVLDINYNAAPIKDKKGKVIGALEIVTNQTDIKNAQRLAQKISDYQDKEVAKLSDALILLGQGNSNVSLKTGSADKDTAATKKTFDSIFNAFNQTISAVQNLTSDANMLVKAAVEGKLKTRADASKHQGDFKKIVDGVNATLDAVINPLNDASEILQKVAQGNLTIRLTKQYEGDYVMLKDSINTTIESQYKLVNNLLKRTEDLTGSSNSLLKISEQLASYSTELSSQTSSSAASSEQVSSNVSTVSSSAEEMAASIKEIAKNTALAANLAKESQENASAASEVMNKLGESSQEIGNIVKTITSIAEQTNLLALNATIEAARAGESGKGFAVVANEVKELAKESAKATEDITNRIKTVQEETTRAIGVIDGIIGNIKKINDVSNTIASAVEEQSVTTSEVNRNLNEASKGVSSIVEVNTGISSSVSEYSKMASNLKTSATSLQETAKNLEKMLKNSYIL